MLMDLSFIYPLKGFGEILIEYVDACCVCVLCCVLCCVVQKTCSKIFPSTKRQILMVSIDEDAKDGDLYILMTSRSCFLHQIKHYQRPESLNDKHKIIILLSPHFKRQWMYWSLIDAYAITQFNDAFTRNFTTFGYTRRVLTVDGIPCHAIFCCGIRRGER